MKQIIKQYWLGVVAVFLIGIAAWMVVEKLHPKKLPANLVEGVGRMDGDLIRLNVKYPGRLAAITIEEGDAIKRGQIVAKLKSDEYQAKLAQIEAKVSAKSEELSAKRTELVMMQQTVPLLLRRADAQLKARKAQQEAITREIEGLEKVVEQDKKDVQRLRNLYQRQLIQKELYEKAQLKLETDKKRLRAMMRRRDQAYAAILVAKADRVEAEASQKRVMVLQKGIRALQEGIEAMQKVKNEIEAILAEMTIRSPVDGFVIDKIANVGEVLGAGMPVATLIDPKTLYLKIYIDTLENGKIKLGDKAVIFLDAYPNRPIAAKVVQIAQKAEFTPKEVSVRSDRIQRVYAVHLKPLEPNPLLKLGIPAVGVVSLDDKGLPKSLDEIPVL